MLLEAARSAAREARRPLARLGASAARHASSLGGGVGAGRRGAADLATAPGPRDRAASPLVAALLRDGHPARWAAARRAASSFAPRRAGADAVRTRAWEAVRSHATRGVHAPRLLVASPRVLGGARASPAATRALSRLSRRVARFAFENLRAPSAVFLLHAQQAAAGADAALARRLPNFTGALVMLLVGGQGLVPRTARCLERVGERRRDDDDDDETKTRRRARLLAPSAASAASAPVVVVIDATASSTGTWFDHLVPASLRGFAESFLTALRAAQLAVLFSPALALAPLLLYAAGDAGAAAWYRLFRRTLELGGAAFIKWGQWASTRYDVFPAKLCRELEELQASAPEHSWARTKAVLERAYGGADRVGAIFAWMDPKPIASGSIAQIHRAKLRAGVAEKNGAGPQMGFQQRLLRSAQAGVDLLASGEWRRVAESVVEEWRLSAGKWEWNPGSFVGSGGGGRTDADASASASLMDAVTRYARSALHPLEGPEGDSREGRYVAVKVRHPGVVDALRRDFAILAWLAHAAGSIEFLRPFQLEHTVQQFGVHMLQQVDLTKEARNLRRFKECFSLWPTVTFPTPVQGLATEEVLVETFEEGVSISSFLMDPLPAKAMDEAIREGPPGASGGVIGGAGEKENKKDDVGITGITGTSGAAAGGDKVEEAAAKAARAAAYAAAVEVPEENKHLAALGVKTLLKMLIDDNFLHADLHPGNILVRLREGMVDGVPTGRGSFRGEEPSEDRSDAPSRGEEGTTRRGGSGSGSGSGSSGAAAASSVPAIKPEIVILDTGLATELTPHQQAGLAEFFQAIISWDGAGVANKIISFSSTPATNLDVEGFKRDISRAVGRFSESTPRAGDCMSAIFETVQRYHVTIDPNVMVAVVTVMVLEGWQFRLDPTINILDYIGDVLKSSFRKHQRLSMVDYALRDMWAPFSEPNALMLDRSGSRGRATENDGA